MSDNKFDKKDYEAEICFISIMDPPENDLYRKQARYTRSQNVTAIQLSIIDGLTKANGERPWIINTAFVPRFPKGYSSPKVVSSKIDGTYCGVNHSFLNFSPVYSSSLFGGAKKHLKEWASQKSGRMVIAYSLTSYTMKAINYIKSINPNVTTAIIVPDLPQFTYIRTKNPMRALKNFLGKKKVLRDIKRYSKCVDGWILFSDKMKEQLPKTKSSMVFEGIATDIFGNVEPKTLFPQECKTILYAGGLHANYGVKMLLDAFALMPEKHLRLVLAGKGDLVPEIESRSAEDDRIVYLGEIPRKELLSLEKGASVLVNPRINSGIFTRYSFPSKNMEYLSSGTSTVGYKLDGIPDEYDNLINYFDDGSPEALAKTLLRVLGDDAEMAHLRAQEAKEYVLKHKSKDFWGERIIRFLSEKSNID